MAIGGRPVDHVLGVHERLRVEGTLEQKEDPDLLRISSVARHLEPVLRSVPSHPSHREQQEKEEGKLSVSVRFMGSAKTGKVMR